MHRISLPEIINSMQITSENRRLLSEVLPLPPHTSPRVGFKAMFMEFIVRGRVVLFCPHIRVTESTCRTELGSLPNTLNSTRRELQAPLSLPSGQNTIKAFSLIEI